MGLQLNGLVSQRPATRDDLAGRIVAIDVPNLAYAFYTIAMMRDATAREAAVRAAHRGVVSRVLDLAEIGARSVLVLDGPPHPLKAALLEHREANRKFPRLEALDFEPLQGITGELGVPLVQAPHDAEAQASSMSAAGVVDIVATTDWDALAMGARVLLRCISGASPIRGAAWQVVDARDALRELGLARREDLAAAAVLMGCDYFDGIPGIGPKKALQRVREHGDGPARALAPAALDALERPAYDAAAPVRWTRPDGPRLRATLDTLGIDDRADTRARLARLSLLHDRARTTLEAFATPEVLP